MMGYASEEEICRALKKKDLSKFPNPTDLKPLAQALWILEITKDSGVVNRLTAKAISYLLFQLREIPLDEKTILRAFARAGKKVKAHKEAGKVYYEITVLGRKFLQANSFLTSSMGVHFYSGEQSWSDLNKEFPKIIERLEGELCIVDRYYGNGTFHVLSLFGNDRKIRFLSSELGGEEQRNAEKFNKNLQRFKSEFKNIELRRYSNGYELHDRYIIAKNALVVIGHGIKDLGNKESFVIFLPKDFVHGFLPNLKAIFEHRWSNSTKI